MKRVWLIRTGELAALGLTLFLAISGLLTDNGDPLPWLLMIAMVPAIVVAFRIGEGMLEHRENAVLVATSRLSALCYAATIAMLAVVVGARLWGTTGGVAGAVVGLLVGIETVSAYSHLNRTLAASRSGESPPSPGRARSVLLIVASMLGSVLMLAVFAGFGYLLFGRAGAVVIVLPALVFYGMAVVRIVRMAGSRDTS